MDLVRSCYRSSMRLYSDRPDILVAGRWYRCPPTAQPVGWTTFFARRNDLEDRGDYPLGEVFQPRYTYTKLAPNARLTGTRPCGSTTVWTQGVPYDTPSLPVGQNGIPICCGVIPRSSLVLGGSGVRVRLGVGSLLLGSPPGPFRVGGSTCACSTVAATITT